MVNQELNTFKKDFYSCLPKLAVYFGIIFAIWLVTIAILGPLGKGVFIGGVESSSVVLWSALLAIFILLVPSTARLTHGGSLARRHVCRAKQRRRKGTLEYTSGD